MSGVSAKGILKDNKDIFLPLGGLLVLVLIIVLGSGSSMNLFSPLDTLENKKFVGAEDVLEEGRDYAAIIETSQGRIEIDLFEDEVPISVNNFVFLSELLITIKSPFSNISLVNTVFCELPLQMITFSKSVISSSISAIIMYL